MKFWKREEIKQLCKEKMPSIDEQRLLEYWDAIAWKMDRSHYHINMYQKVLKEYDEYKSKQSVITEPNDKWRETYHFALAEVEALIETLNSLVDMIVQMVNLMVLDSVFEEASVNLKKVIKKLEERGMTGILEKIKYLNKNHVECDEVFIYIRAFCNTIKHRKLVEAQHKMLISVEKKKIEEGIYLKNFSYNGKDFKEMWAYKLIEEFAPRMFNIIYDVGVAIDEYIEQVE